MRSTHTLSCTITCMPGPSPRHLMPCKKVRKLPCNIVACNTEWVPVCNPSPCQMRTARFQLFSSVV